jgi:hypothetical protein
LLLAGSSAGRDPFSSPEDPAGTGKEKSSAAGSCTGGEAARASAGFSAGETAATAPAGFSAAVFFAAEDLLPLAFAAGGSFSASGDVFSSLGEAVFLGIRAADAGRGEVAAPSAAFFAAGAAASAEGAWMSAGALEPFGSVIMFPQKIKISAGDPPVRVFRENRA